MSVVNEIMLSLSKEAGSNLEGHKIMVENEEWSITRKPANINNARRVLVGSCAFFCDKENVVHDFKPGYPPILKEISVNDFPSECKKINEKFFDDVESGKDGKVGFFVYLQ